jgi:flavin reductase (DIM6/NTAB) family NADH-FMN oxidoreductase RutF
MGVEREVFRRIAGSFPTGIAVVTAIDPDGIPKGLTTQTFVPVSTEPPLVLISIDRTSRTLATLRVAPTFTVNLLRAGQETISDLFASKALDKFSTVHWDRTARGGCVLRDASVAYAECERRAVFPQGDHWLFIGEVVAGETFDAAPLMYFRRAYAPWPAPERVIV